MTEEKKPKPTRKEEPCGSFTHNAPCCSHAAPHVLHLVDLNRSERTRVFRQIGALFERDRCERTPALNSLCEAGSLQPRSHVLSGPVGPALIRRGARNQSADGSSPSPTGFGKTLVETARRFPVVPPGGDTSQVSPVIS